LSKCTEINDVHLADNLFEIRIELYLIISHPGNDIIVRVAICIQRDFYRSCGEL
jgi:hypothetical protein